MTSGNYQKPLGSFRVARSASIETLLTRNHRSSPPSFLGWNNDEKEKHSPSDVEVSGFLGELDYFVVRHQLIQIRLVFVFHQKVGRTRGENNNVCDNK